MQPAAQTEPQMDAARGPGTLELLRSLTGLRDDPLDFLQQAAGRYGDLVRFKIGPLHAFVLSRAEDIQHVLQDNNRNYTKDTLQYNALAQVTGRGLLTSDGDFWLSQRRRMQPAFHRPQVQGYAPLMVEAAERAVRGWQEAGARGEPVDIDRELMKLTLEILGRALLGADLRTEAPALTEAVLTALDHIVLGLKRPSLLPSFVPTPERHRFQQALRRLDAAVQEILAAHRASAGQTGAAQNHLLGAMLRPSAQEAPMSDRQVRDELITILIAGHETVASALTWTCYLLSQHPHVEARMREELEQTLAGRPPTASDLPRLDYTRRVFDEALRLYPPAWLVTRKNIREDFIRGVRIPPGSLIVVAIAATHRNPAYWPEPAAFDPDRFQPEAAASRPRFAYLPFGGGPRLCIGNHFALLEGPMVLTSIYQRCRLELQPGWQVVVDALVTLRPRGGLPMRVVDWPVKSAGEPSPGTAP